MKRCDEHIHIHYWTAVADIAAGRTEVVVVGTGIDRIGMLAEVTGSLHPVVADLAAGHMAGAAAVAEEPAIVVGMAAVMRSASEGLEADYIATEEALARGTAPAVLRHLETQARLAGLLLTVAKICSWYDVGIKDMSRSGSRNRFEVKG